jgi:MYXO-CTERM domain-containing protein
VNKARVKLSDDCFTIVFGACNYHDFKSTDLPPMQVRNIRLRAGTASYSWPLHETAGAVAADELHQAKAAVVNPIWIAPLHRRWRLEQAGTVSGNGSAAFNAATEELYITGKDSLYRFSVKTGGMQAQAFAPGGQHHLLMGNRSFVHPPTGQLYQVNVDQQWITPLRQAPLRWEAPFDTAELTEHWQANVFYPPGRDELYILGGYGQLRYKNRVARYNFATRTWDSVRTNGDTYTPRYLAALGATGDSAYILGGFGSTTGEQILNPRYLYDLLLFDARTGSMKKLLNIDVPGEPWVFANSMYIDAEAGHWYALAFPNDRFDSRLQLVKGSLENGSYELLADTIPYTFRDTRSFADLYYCAAGKKLLAVTLHTEQDKHTAYKIYTIAFPPDKVAAPPKPGASGWSINWWYYPAGLLLLALALLFSLRRRRRRRKEEEGTDEPENGAPAAAVKPAIQLFGNFSVTDAGGQDLTRQFTPLLKELFLLIMLYTVKSGHGISVETLNEILWNDKSDKAAKNNRSVNMLKLKGILEKLGSCSFKKESGKWVFVYSPEEVQIDLADFLRLAENRAALDREKVRCLLQIVKRGAFLSQTDYEWLDDIKSDVSNKVLDILLYASTILTPPADAELLIEIANSIFYFDQVNEQALALKCKNLIALGRHSLAKNTYEKFARDYRHMYDEDFPKSYNDTLH